MLEAYQAGADDCIPPPVSSRLFQAKIHAWLRRAQANQSPSGASGDIALDLADNDH